MSDELISIMEIAKILGKHRQSVHKIVQRLGLETTKIKSEEARGQLATYISKEDFELVKDAIASSDLNSSEGDEVDINVPGYFYVIQLEPQHDPGRIKVGFATSVDERLRKHKTAAPFSTVIKSWPCKLSWEKTAIDSVTQGCERLYTEVYRTDNLEKVIERCEKFFSLMPSLESE